MKGRLKRSQVCENKGTPCQGLTDGCHADVAETQGWPLRLSPIKSTCLHVLRLSTRQVAIPMNLPLSTLPKRSRFYLPGRAGFHLIDASLEDEEHCGRRKRNDSLPSSVSRAQVHELRCEIPGSVARVTAHQGRILPDIAACLQVGYRVDTEVRSNPSAVFE